MATEKQIAANRRNAQLSTGPVTPEGKAQSCRNSTVHGLAGKGLVYCEDFEKAVDARAAELNSSLKPFNDWELQLTRFIARDALRLEEIATRQTMRRCLVAYRAQHHWDEDRHDQATQITKRLEHDPPSVVSQVMRTPQGCRLLINWWEMLRKSPQVWTAGARRATALDILGVPPELRIGGTPIDWPDAADPVERQKAFAQQQIDRLEEIIAGPVGWFDEQERYQATLGLCETDPELKLLQRYERDYARRLARYQGMFKKMRAGDDYIKFDDMSPRQQDQDEAGFKARRQAAAAEKRAWLKATRPEPPPPPPIPDAVAVAEPPLAEPPHAEPVAPLTVYAAPEPAEEAGADAESG